MFQPTSTTKKDHFTALECFGWTAFLFDIEAVAGQFSINLTRPDISSRRLGHGIAGCNLRETRGSTPASALRSRVQSCFASRS